MSESTAVTKPNPRAELRTTLARYSDKLAAFGVRPEAYIEAALMAVVKTPDLLKCTPESIALALRQCAQTGLEIGRTAHLMPFGTTCTFVPGYNGLIELACATGKVASIRVRSVYEGEEFQYGEDISGPVLKHTPRMTGVGGKIIGAYAVADLRFNRYKVEWMTAEEIDAIRTTKSKSWKSGALTDWYARKTVVRRLCKTLPSNAKLQQALKYDDAEGEDIPDGELSPLVALPSKGYTMTTDYSDDAAAPRTYDPNAVAVTEVSDDAFKAARARVQHIPMPADPYEEDAA